MAGFCGKCGRPLQDGEVCNCQGTQPQQQFGGAAPRPNGYQPNGYQGQPGGYGAQPGGYTPPPNGYYGQPGGYPGGAPNQSGQAVNQAKDAVKEVVPLVKSPFTKTQEIARSGDLAIGIGGIAVELVMALLIVFTVRGKIAGLFGSGLGKIGMNYVLNEIGLGVGKLLVVTLLFAVGIPCLKALLLKVFTKDVFKGQTSFQEMLTVEGVRGLLMAAVLLLTFIFALISAVAAIYVYALGTAAIVGVEPILYAGTARLDNNKKVYVFLIVAAIVALVSLVIAGVYGASIGSGIADLAGSSFGDLDDILDAFY